MSMFVPHLGALISIYSTSAAPTPQTRTHVDLSKKNRDPTTLPYKDVASRYTSIPYNATIAKTTLDTVITLFRDYCAFRESVLTPDLKAPFSSAPVDGLKELDVLRTREFKSDFEFHSTVGRVVDSLHDTHASYYEDCYDKYLFIQNSTIYASVIKGMQHFPPRNGPATARRTKNASSPTTADAPLTPNGLDARQVAAGATTVYYQLKDKPHVGVVVVFSHEAIVQELETARQAFKDFHDNGVTHLIIDIQSNGGGGAVSSLDKLSEVFRSSGMVPPFEDLPYLEGGISLPFLRSTLPPFPNPRLN
ncbi:hypothetical protein KI688_007036 [Linnemannia hyalina]|uniref:Tail specific protease domain-containing protein n=1 Tax=Linnemannia hyalina TaxID=64524 RepID=A0A9P8BN56_9FUNG|nr:hypothetical protein KI688_007036 [Linnemannia hyalina]